MALPGSVKFIIRVDEYGNVEVHDAADQELTPESQSPKTRSLSAEAMALDGANKLIAFDTLTVMGFGAETIVTRVCVKRANCTWYCY